jgi:hypothetical protein
MFKMPRILIEQLLEFLLRIKRQEAHKQSLEIPPTNFWLLVVDVSSLMIRVIANMREIKILHEAIRDVVNGESRSFGLNLKMLISEGKFS